ncbi:hypothetical protein A9Q89_10305 [Gammaproteobacteria bacterium 53_120_T64]|nr:hypothetical protein A9Q89_10305 [Gammaproteobacteria bacterium 53_120_T64]
MNPDLSTDRFRHLVEHVDDVLWRCDLALNFSYISPASEKVTGFTPEERIAQKLEDKLTSGSLQALRNIVKEQLAQEQQGRQGPLWPIHCNFESYHKNGSVIPIETSLSFVRDDQGRLSEMVGVNRDVTERNQILTTVKSIHDSTARSTGEHFFSELLLQLTSNLDMRYGFIATIENGNAQTLNFCRAGKVADNFSYALRHSPCENVLENVTCYYPEQVCQHFPLDIGLQKLGVESYIGTPISNTSGKVEALLVLMDDQPIKDIPLLKRVLEICADRAGAELSRSKTERKLQESEQRFRALFEQSMDPCIIHNRAGQIINANQSMEQTFGHSMKRLKHLNVSHLNSDNKKAQAIAKTAFSDVSSKGSSRFETQLKKKSGETFPVEVTSKMISVEGEDLVLSVIRDLSEQYRLREEEKNTQQTLSQLFNDLNTAIAILNSDGSVHYANTTPFSNPDVHQASTLDKKIWEYQALSHDPAMQALIKADVNTALRGQHTQRDAQLLTPDGLLWMQIDVHPVFNRLGQVAQLLVEGLNIDPHKKMAVQLLGANQRRKLLREQAPMPIVEWDVATGQISEWNVAAEKLFGFSVAEAKGQTPEFLTPNNVAVNAQALQQSLSLNANHITSKNRCKDGRTLFCEWYNSPIKDASGAVIAVVSIVRNITAEHQAQRILRHRDAEQREILNTMVDAVFTIDENAKLLSFNHAAEQLFGHDAADIIGQLGWQLLPAQYVTKCQHHLRRFAATAEPKHIGLSDVIAGQRKDGSTFPSRMSIAALRTKTRGRQQFIVSLHDLTQEKQQEEQLRRSQKMDALGKLTGGIAHDFNNMLGIIMGYSDLLTATIKDQPKLTKYADEIYRAGARGAQLTEKLLGFTRQKNASAEQLSVNTLLQHQRYMLAKTITPRIKLELELCPNLWPVYLDSGDLGDAILNISINAMHAMPEGGRLSIVTKNEPVDVFDAPLIGLSKGDYVSLSISDTGCGMDQATQEKIFDPFFSTKGEFGTGLGLSQVYGFIERSKGLIKTYSEPGHGTRLTLYFPRHQETPAAPDSNNSSSSKHRLNGTETILVVDDEEALLNLSSEILRPCGYQVIPVSSGQQALEVLKNTPVQLMISDVIMPEMDGYQLAATVQAQYPEVKIQLASGFTDDRHSSQLDATLLENMMQKPFKVKVLIANVRKLLDS